MLSRSQKEELVKNLIEKIKNSKAVIFTDFKGLKVKELRELKKELRQFGVEFKVAKKKLMDIALEETKMEVRTKKMEGQIAISFSQDEIAPAKIIDKFAKKNENIKIMGGILNSKAISVEEAKLLAKLSSKEDLLAKLTGTIKAPMAGFLNVLNGNLRGLLQVLKAIADKK